MGCGITYLYVPCGMDSTGTSQAVPSTLPLSPLSIPSHCTVGKIGQHGNIPISPIHTTPIPTVHPIPVYRGKDWTAREHPKQSHPRYPYPHCPSHPNVPWEGLDSVGTSQVVPSALPLSPLSIPSHCTVGRIGQHGNIPRSPIHTNPIPTVHPIPMYRGKDWTAREHPKQSLPHYPYPQVRPAVHATTGMEQEATTP